MDPGGAATPESRPADARGNEQPVRYFVLGGMVGLPSLSLLLRTLTGLLLWFTWPPLLVMLLTRAGATALRGRLERWWAGRVTRHLGIRLELSGLEHIDPGTAYVVAPLHEGFADVLALLHLPLNLRFAARDELFGWRLVGRYLRATRQVVVWPESPRRSYRHLLRAGRDVFRDGESLVIFPQGTILGIESDCMPGAFALARAMNCPLLPIALTGSHRVWEYPYSPRLRYGQRMSLRVFPPVTVHERGQEVLDQLRREVQTQLKQAALDGSMAQPRRFVPERDGYWDGFAYRIDPDFVVLKDKIDRHRHELRPR